MKRLLINKLRGEKNKSEKGEVFLLTLVFLLLGIILVVPLLSYMSSGLKTGKVYNDKADALYAADAGIEDAKWKIKYDHLKSTLSGYDPMEFNTVYSYALPQNGGQPPVNGDDVQVTIQNMWIPKSINTPDCATANSIINDNSVVIAGGGIRTDFSYHISIAYENETGDNLTVNSIGVWLPPGYAYTTGSSNLDDGSSSGKSYHSVPAVSDHLGGKAVVWSFQSLAFTSFPNVSTVDWPMSTEITFNYSSTLNSTADSTPDAVSWITYGGLAGGTPTYSWDYDVRVFNVTSTANDTMVKTYLSKTEIRKTGGSLNGDYYATGNTIMRDATNDSNHIRDTWVNTDGASTNSSSQTVTALPEDSNIVAAYLYWTGWIRDQFIDFCSTISTYWTTGSNNVWSVSSNKYRGHYTSGYTRYIYLKSNQDLSNCSEAYISWDQSIASPTDIFTDSCSSTNFLSYWTNGGDWAYNSSNGNYQANHNGAESCRSLTKSSAVDLSSYGSVTLSWTQGIILPSRVPTGNGDSSGTWSAYPGTSANWDCVNETSYNDSDYITGSTASGGYCLFTISPSSIPAGATINSLTVYIRAERTSSGSDNITERIKVNGNYYDGGTTHNPGRYSYTTYSYSWTKNPNTGLAWALADINGTGASPLQQIGVSSTDLNPSVRVSMVYASVDYSPAPSAEDGLLINYSADGGTTWSDNYTVFQGSIPASSASYTIPSQYLTNNFKVRYFLLGCTTTGTYVYIDDIKLTPVYVAADNLTLSISDNGGSSYTDVQTYHADDTSDVSTTSATVVVPLPSDYLNSATLTAFRMKFTLNGFGGSGEYYYLDNIKITAVKPDVFNSVYLKINDNQTYFDDDSPACGNEDITADNIETIINAVSTSSKGYSFACFKDVTDLVKAYSDGGDWSAADPEDRTDGNGNAKYTTGNVMASLGEDDQSSYGDQLAHAGWSLILVYQSPSTLSHQIYLYDRFTYAEDDTTSNSMRGDLDFDTNGLPGGDISGFIIPSQTQDEDGNWETNAAQITCFVGEGDEWIPGDFIALNAPDNYWDSNYTVDLPYQIPLYNKLWDNEDVDYNSTGVRNNVWNGLSTSCTADGIDVDTFTIKWSEGLISPGQTSAHLDLYTSGSANPNSDFNGGDNWNLVYIIFSFRSEITTSGSLGYLIEY